jgi:hypothetical protein
MFNLVFIASKLSKKKASKETFNMFSLLINIRPRSKGNLRR